jgi:ectoine hydroxylase-related dioxygenase (phytanoyl-CoA dioxygenase family)
MNDPGYSIEPRVLDDAEVSDLVLALAAPALERSRAGARHLLGIPAIASLARHPRLLALASRALGGAARPFNGTLFDKSQQANWHVAWHQDTALPLRERREVAGWGPWSVKGGVPYAHTPAGALSRVLALRVHLDDSTGLNGPLRVLPGTHTLGVLSDDQIRTLAARLPAVECTVPRGGVVAMRPLLVHSSSKMSVAASRRVIHIEYAVSVGLEAGLELRVA